MRLSQFRYLLSLAAHGSFSKAAQELYVAQSSISQAIKELEDELGFLIIRRSNRGVSFTPQGKVVLEKAANIIKEVNSLKEMSNVTKDALNGQLSIGISPHIFSFMLIDIVIDFKALYPNLNIQMKDADAISIVRDVYNASLDMGLIFLCTPDRLDIKRKIHQNNFEVYELFKSNMRFVVRSGHPLFQKKGRLSLRDTVQYPHVVYSEAVHKVVVEIYQNHGILNEVTIMNNFDSILYYIAKTNAITLVVDQWLDEQAYLFNDTKIQPLELDDFISECTAICIRNSGNMTSSEKLILDYLTHSY